MKRTIKQYVLAMLAIAVLSVTVGNVVNAESVDKQIHWLGVDTDSYSVLGLMPESVKSDNTKVLSVKKKGEVLLYKFKKVGNAKVTYVYKDGDTKETVVRQYSCRKNKSPVVKFKLGSKNYTSKLKMSCEAYDSKVSAKTVTKGKLSVKLAKGWKIKDITITSYTDGRVRKVKNGATINQKGPFAIFVNAKDKNGYNTTFYLQKVKF